MGAGIHSMLQQQNDDGSWETIMYDCMQYGSSEIRAGWHEICREYFTQGLPTDLKVSRDADGLLYYKQHWLGEYGHCWIDMEDLLNLPVTIDSRVIVDNTEDEVIVTYIKNTRDYFDADTILEEFQKAAARIFPLWNKLRLVVGFDS